MRADEVGAGFPPGRGVRGEGGPRRLGVQRGGERRRRPQPMGGEETRATSPTGGKQEDGGRRPQPLGRTGAGGDVPNRRETEEGGVPNLREAKGQGATSPTREKPEERRLSPQPPRSKGTGGDAPNRWETRREGAVSPTFTKRKDTGKKSPTRRKREERGRRPQLVGREAAAAPGETSEGDSPLSSAGPPIPRNRTTPLSQSTRRGRAPRPEPRRPGCQTPGPKAAATASPGRPKPVPQPRTPYFRLLCRPGGSQGRGKGLGGGREAELGLCAPWRRSSTGARAARRRSASPAVKPEHSRWASPLKENYDVETCPGVSVSDLVSSYNNSSNQNCVFIVSCIQSGESPTWARSLDLREFLYHSRTAPSLPRKFPG